MLLAVLLCSVSIIAMPVVAEAASPATETQSPDRSADDDSPSQLTAGDVSPGEAEAVLQLDKAVINQVLQNLLQHAYPKHSGSPAVPAFYSFSRRDCGLYTILTKGP